jgi:hypothetical protein
VFVEDRFPPRASSNSEVHLFWGYSGVNSAPGAAWQRTEPYRILADILLCNRLGGKEVGLRSGQLMNGHGN